METKDKQNLFFELENNKPFAKMALEGFAGDGKTYTAVELAIGIHKLIGSTKPIASVDTERAIDKLKFRFDEAGIKVMSTQGRTLANVSKAIEMCSGGFADILIIDSITHIWENFIEAYKAEKKRTSLQFQDWGIIKPKWKKEFSDVFVLANCHIIFTGRAGYEYEDEVNKETGKREIFKSGIKMKAENETAFEPDILILMEKVQNVIGDQKEIYRNATIIKDRTTKVDGLTFKNPTFNDFYPAIKVLLDGTLKEIHGTDLPDTFHDFESRFSEIGRKRTIYISEIEGAFNFMQLGTSKEDKALKSAILKKVFGVLSLEATEGQPIQKLQEGHQSIKSFANRYTEYVSQCLDSGVKVDPKRIGELLDEEINPLKAID